MCSGAPGAACTSLGPLEDGEFEEEDSEREEQLRAGEERRGTTMWILLHTRTRCGGGAGRFADGVSVPAWVT